MKYGLLYLGTAQLPLSSATHSYHCALYFPVSKQWYGCQCLGCLTWAQMLMQAIAHGGRTDTVKSPLYTGSWLCSSVPGIRTRVSFAPGFSVGRSISWVISAPVLLLPMLFLLLWWWLFRLLFFVVAAAILLLVYCWCGCCYYTKKTCCRCCCCCCCCCCSCCRWWCSFCFFCRYGVSVSSSGPSVVQPLSLLVLRPPHPPTLILPLSFLVPSPPPHHPFYHCHF